MPVQKLNKGEGYPATLVIFATRQLQLTSFDANNDLHDVAVTKSRALIVPLYGTNVILYDSLVPS